VGVKEVPLEEGEGKNVVILVMEKFVQYGLWKGDEREVGGGGKRRANKN